MLTVPIDKITILLEQAFEVEIAPEDDAAESEEESEAESAGDDLEEALAAIPAYRELKETLDGLTDEEVYELLAVAAMSDSDDAEDPWDTAVERAQSVAAEEAVGELARILVLTDAIETGLERLGYRLAGDREFEVVAAEQD